MHYFSIKAFLYGIPIGFIFSFALGPVFFTIIKTSLERGFKSTIPITIGVVLADLVLLALAYSGLEAFIPKDLHISFWVNLIGGLFLIILGIYTFINRNKVAKAKEIGLTALVLQNLFKGFLLNILNPTNFMEWVGTVSILRTKYHYEIYQNISFFTRCFNMCDCDEFGHILFRSPFAQNFDPQSIGVHQYNFEYYILRLWDMAFDKWLNENKSFIYTFSKWTELTHPQAIL